MLNLSRRNAPVDGSMCRSSVQPAQPVSFIEAALAQRDRSRQGLQAIQFVTSTGSS